jgi:hypothetical protein
MSLYTLTYSPGAEGWPSFYSFYPEKMIGMNNYFYTFKGANLYRHNTNETRNNFYGVQYSSQLTSVINDSPLENKLFKTINLEGDAPWTMSPMDTDLAQNYGEIDAAWFDKKEQSYYAFIRSNTQTPPPILQYAQRSTGGIGKPSAVNSLSPTTQAIEFSITPLVSIGNVVSIGDYLYYADAPSFSVPVLAGEIIDITVNLPAGDNYITIDNTTPGATPVPNAGVFIMYIKSATAESHGLLGHYLRFVATNTDTSKVELFSVESEVMKSYP